MFSSLSDPTRLKILNLLMDKKELCVCHLMEGLNMSQSKISRHLRYMYNAGLVEYRQEERWMHYSISSKLSKEAKTTLSMLKKIMRGCR